MLRLQRRLQNLQPRKQTSLRRTVSQQRPRSNKQWRTNRNMPNVNLMFTIWQCIKELNIDEVCLNGLSTILIKRFSGPSFSIFRSFKLQVSLPCLNFNLFLYCITFFRYEVKFFNCITGRKQRETSKVKFSLIPFYCWNFYNCKLKLHGECPFVSYICMGNALL